MTDLTRWDQFRELTNIHDRMNRLFQEGFGSSREEGLSTSAFLPPTDVYEDKFPKPHSKRASRLPSHLGVMSSQASAG